MKLRYVVALAAMSLAAPLPMQAEEAGPFWNAHSEWFMFAPAFDFPSAAGAARYRYTVVDDSLLEHSFESPTSKASLAPVWDAVPVGLFVCVCQGLDTAGRPVGDAARRRGWKLASFDPGAYAPRARPYAEAAAKVYDYIFDLGHVRYFREHGRPDPSYKLNCYPTKMHASLIYAMVGYARLRPARRAAALDLARKAADYLISISEPAGAPTACFPPTYEAADAFKHFTASTYEGQTMILYPAEAGRVYLSLSKAAGDAKYRDAAVAIADTYLKLQGEDGAWPLKLHVKDGTPVGANRAFPVGIASFLEEVYAETGDERYRKAADRAMVYVEKGPMVDFNWEGQFEDVRPTEKYVNLTEHHAADACLYMAARHPDDKARIARCRDVMRFCEDQFVLWERPCRADGTGIRTGRKDFFRVREYLKWYLFPSVTEQYHWNIPIDASSAKMIRAYVAMWRVCGDKEYLAKAKALGDALTRAQLPSGRIPTHFDETNLKDPQLDWVNCMVHSAWSLDVLAEAEREASRPLAQFVGTDKGRLPGYVAVSGHGGDRPKVECGGLADAKAGRKASADTVFWSQSVAEDVVAVALLALEDESVLWIEDGVEQYLPEWKDVRVQATGAAPKRRPTLRMLLSHTAGLPPFPSDDASVEALSPRERTRLAAATPLASEPGEEFRHSAWGVDVAVAAVEAATGRPFEETVRRLVLDPLGMMDTSFAPSAGAAGRLAKRYRLSDDAPAQEAARSAGPGTGVFSTATDLAKFYAMVANCGTTPCGRQVTAPMSMREWFYRRTPADAGATHRFGDFGISGWANHKGGNYRIWLVCAEGANAGLGAARTAWEEN